MSKEVNYTAEQEARIAEVAEENGFIDNALAEMLASELSKDVRSIRGKAVRMGVYRAKAKTSKTGGKIESKEAIATEIAQLVGASVDGIEKASKLALQRIREALSA